MDALTLTKLLLVTTLCLHTYTRAQNNQCGSIGNSNESELSVQTERRFYLNTANPAPCNGNITSWRVCYYGPSSVDQDERISYRSTYAVYRMMGSGGDERYEQVSTIFHAAVSTSSLAAFDPGRTLVDDVVQQGGLTCYSDTNDIDTPIPVQTGDLVGACIFDPKDESFFTRQQLNFVGTVNGESLMGMSDSGCTLDTLPSSVEAGDLSTSNNRRLHIYANIVSNVISTTQPPTTLSTTNVEGSTANINVDLTTGNPLSTAIPTDIPDSESPSTMASTITDIFSTTTTLHDKGQVAGVVVIAASSSGGGVFLILILVLFVIILVFVSLKKCKTKTYNYSTNVAYSERTTEHLSTQIDDYEVVTDNNVAYELDTKLEVRMEENTAYKPTVIPVSHNVTYVGVGRSQDEIEKQDDYDYINI